jgi:hypothetical protein
VIQKILIIISVYIFDQNLGNCILSIDDDFETCTENDNVLRTKHQYSIEKPQKSTQRLEKEIISDNKPLRGGNLLLPHLNVQVQDDSK